MRYDKQDPQTWVKTDTRYKLLADIEELFRIKKNLRLHQYERLVFDKGRFWLQASVPKLGEIYEVSATAVNAALRKLVRDGYIYWEKSKRGAHGHSLSLISPTWVKQGAAMPWLK